MGIETQSGLTLRSSGKYTALLLALSALIQSCFQSPEKAEIHALQTFLKELDAVNIEQVDQPLYTKLKAHLAAGEINAETIDCITALYNKIYATASDEDTEEIGTLYHAAEQVKKTTYAERISDIFSLLSFEQNLPEREGGSKEQLEQVSGVLIQSGDQLYYVIPNRPMTAFEAGMSESEFLGERTYPSTKKDNPKVTRTQSHPTFAGVKTATVYTAWLDKQTIDTLAGTKQLIIRYSGPVKIRKQVATLRNDPYTGMSITAGTGYEDLIPEIIFGTYTAYIPRHTQVNFTFQ